MIDYPHKGLAAKLIAAESRITALDEALREARNAALEEAAEEASRQAKRAKREGCTSETIQRCYKIATYILILRNGPLTPEGEGK